MAQVKRKTLDRYNDALRRIYTARGEQMREAVKALNLTNPTAADLDAVSLALRTITDAATFQTEIVAGSFYDGIRFDALGQVSGTVPQATRNPEAVDRAARGIVEKYAKAGETQEQIANRLAERVSYEVKRAAASTVYNMGSAEAPRLRKGLRYARVPGGNETCDFCIMLASRGPVYHDARRAGSRGNHYHADCDCVITPMWDTESAGISRRLSKSTTVEGYDPNAYYERYQESELGKRYQMTAATNAGKVSEKAAKEWEEGLSAAAARGEKYKPTKSEQRAIYDTLKDSQYGYMLDMDYEAILAGSYQTENEEMRRAYHTALAFVQPEWKKDKSTGKWSVTQTKRIIPD